MVNIRSWLRELWKQSPPLMATAVVMAATFVAALIGLVVDNRIITGAPAWLKPAKFGISTAIYSVTLAWVLTQIHIWPRTMKTVAWVTSIVFFIEIAIIDLQAARGTTSHFNASNAFDAALFNIMGIAILLLWIASVVVAVALFRQKFDDRSWAAALRIGMTVTVLGSAAGGFMLRPSRNLPQVRGAHTVGAPDGGPGLPGVGWSTQNGDLRIPHFLGLHAIQAIPFAAYLLRRRRWPNPVAAVRVAGASYLGLVAMLIWQALRGQSIVAPDSSTLALLTTWALATAAGLAVTQSSTRRAAMTANA